MRACCSLHPCWCLPAASRRPRKRRRRRARCGPSSCEKASLGQAISLTGQIQAEKEVALAFRIGGRIIERTVDAGDRVTPDQIVAKLDPQNELNALRSARAALSAAKGRLEQDSQSFRPPADAAAAGLDDTRQFRPGAAGPAHRAGRRRRRQGASRNRGGSRELHRAQGRCRGHDHRAAARNPAKWCSPDRWCSRSRATTAGTPCSTCPAQVLRTAPPDADVTIALTDDPSVTAKGRVRQVDPQADPVTRTFKVARRASTIRRPPCGSARR